MVLRVSTKEDVERMGVLTVVSADMECVFVHLDIVANTVAQWNRVSKLTVQDVECAEVGNVSVTLVLWVMVVRKKSSVQVERH
jgi:hypothetical protein